MEEAVEWPLKHPEVRKGLISVKGALEVLQSGQKLVPPVKILYIGRYKKILWFYFKKDSETFICL